LRLISLWVFDGWMSITNEMKIVFILPKTGVSTLLHETISRDTFYVGCTKNLDTVIKMLKVLVKNSDMELT
jgi:hypothetical protein